MSRARFPVDAERLVRVLLHYRWQRECESVPDYLPPYARDGDRPRCVIRYGQSFLRHSAGPRADAFWDCYGDDFLSPELALLALSKAAPPPHAEAGACVPILDEDGARLTDAPTPDPGAVRVDHERAIRIVASVLGAFSTPYGPVEWSDAEIAFFTGLYDGKWPTGNQSFDRVAIALVRALGLVEVRPVPATAKESNKK